MKVCSKCKLPILILPEIMEAYERVIKMAKKWRGGLPKKFEGDGTFIYNLRFERGLISAVDALNKLELRTSNVSRKRKP